jgi:NAD-dependent deacetylase
VNLALCAFNETDTTGKILKMNKIDTKEYFNIVVLTGAGISVASGLRPFRGPGGLWNEVDVLEYATAQALRVDPFKVWKFSAVLREQLKTTEPNQAHYSLANLEANLKNYQLFTLITQNIDGLHTKAGSKNVIEMHGNVNITKCTKKKCKLKPFEETESHLDKLPLCKLCGNPLRHDIVLFNEDIPMKAQKDIKRSLRGCNLFIAIGTSGEVYPAAGFVKTAKSYGAKTILINLESYDSAKDIFDDVIIGKAEEILPDLFCY